MHAALFTEEVLKSPAAARPLQQLCIEEADLSAIIRSAAVASLLNIAFFVQGDDDVALEASPTMRPRQRLRGNKAELSWLMRTTYISNDPGGQARPMLSAGQMANLKFEYDCCRGHHHLRLQGNKVARPGISICELVFPDGIDLGHVSVGVVPLKGWQ